MGPLEKVVYEKLLEGASISSKLALDLNETRHAVTNTLARLKKAGAVERVGEPDKLRNVLYRAIPGKDTTDLRSAYPNVRGRRLRSEPGSACGRRPADLRTSKEEWAKLLQECYDAGIGSQTISYWTGHAYGPLNQMARDFQLVRNKISREERAQLLLKLMPEETQALVRRIKTRSFVAHERRKARVTQAVARQVHYLMDDDPASCVNNGGTVRPEKEAA